MGLCGVVSGKFIEQPLAMKLSPSGPVLLQKGEWTKV
jgi:hypothetical protein